MKSIFLVIGETGEYSDHHQWTVRAFATAAEAQEVCDRCNSYARTAPDYFTDWHVREAYKAANPDDPSMSYDYTGTRYHIEEVPFGPA